MMMICKKFTFDAAHWLPNVPSDHKCHRMHGHTYTVEVRCTGPVDARGMVLDYAEIADAWAPVMDAVDHRVLNEVEGLENPTTELFALWIVNKLKHIPQLHSVRVYESSTTWCEVEA